LIIFFNNFSAQEKLPKSSLDKQKKQKNWPNLGKK
tara:strand:- start:192 stop:296 length:105 start_codon:yes stop_codon:yes gene_type:complete